MSRKNTTFTLDQEVIERLKQIQAHYEKQFEALGLIGSASQSAIVERLINDCFERLSTADNR
jgi:hypothetical protein